jgi:O-acetylhomoserine (thiol)-lyase
VSKDLVRISVGIEDVEDLLWDLEQAIAASQTA